MGPGVLTAPCLHYRPHLVQLREQPWLKRGENSGCPRGALPMKEFEKPPNPLFPQPTFSVCSKTRVKLTGYSDVTSWVSHNIYVIKKLQAH